jgi:hypothetical protein
MGAINYVSDSGCRRSHWTFSGGDAGGCITTRETAPPVALPDGVIACTKVDHAFGAWQYGKLLAALPVVPGEVYTLSIHGHCSALSGDAIDFRYRTLLNGVEVRHTAVESLGATNASFERKSFQVTIGEGEDQLEFRTMVYNGTGTYWLTAAMVTKTPTLEDYFDGDFVGYRWLVTTPQLDPEILKVNCFADLGFGGVLAGTYNASPEGGRVFRSLDYGATWDAGRQLGAAQGIDVIIPVTSGTIIAGSQGATSLSQWWRSTDAGLTWTRITNGLNVTAGEFGHCGALLDNGDLVIGTYGGGGTPHIYLSSDAGLTWTNVYAPAVEGVFWIEDMGGGLVLAGSGITDATCKVFKSIDHGATWSLLQTISDGSTHVLCIRKLSDGSALLTTGGTGSVWKAVSPGEAFTKVTQLGAETFAYTIRELDDVTVLVGTGPNGAVYRSTDMGGTWSLVKINIATASLVHEICDLGEGLVLATTDNASRISRSSDYGRSWSVENITMSVERTALDDFTQVIGAVSSLWSVFAPLQSGADSAAASAASADAKLDAVKLKTDAIGGPGAITWTYSLTTDDTTPIADADIWVTTDHAGSNVVASAVTDAFGVVTFHLDPGTYYVWAQKAGWNFANPDTEVVT